MAATFTDEGLALIAKWVLGIASPESLMVMLFVPPTAPTPASTFADFTGTTLPGGGPVTLNPSSWNDSSFHLQGDFTYPVISYTFTSSPSGEILTGYMVYSLISSKALWYEVFDIPQTIPATGGAAFLNVEFIDLTGS